MKEYIAYDVNVMTKKKVEIIYFLVLIQVWFQNRRTKWKRQRNALYEDDSNSESEESDNEEENNSSSEYSLAKNSWDQIYTAPSSELSTKCSVIETKASPVSLTENRWGY